MEPPPMTTDAEFLRRFADYAREYAIPWAVVGSHALLAHAVAAGIPAPRPAKDLDLILLLPRSLDPDFRAWIDRKSHWVYEREGLGAIHLWCDDGKQVDLFTKPPGNTGEIDRAVPGWVLGGTYRVACRVDVQAALDRWARDTHHVSHPRHGDHPKFQADADWFRRHFPG